MVTMLFPSIYLFAVVLVSVPVLTVYRIYRNSRKVSSGLAEYYRRSAEDNYNKVYHIG